MIMNLLSLVFLAFESFASGIKIVNVDVSQLTIKTHVTIETLDWDIESEIINCILDSMERFKDVHEVPPLISRDNMMMMLNWPRQNRTKLLEVYEIEEVTPDPMFPMRQNKTLPRRGRFNETAWQPMLPRILQLLFNSNQTRDQVFEHMSPQRGILMEQLLIKVFPQEFISRFGRKTGRRRSQRLNPRGRNRAGGILGALGRIGGALGIPIPIPIPEPSETSLMRSIASEDEEADSEDEVRMAANVTVQVGNPLANIMRLLHMSPAEYSSRNRTLSPNETGLLIEVFRDEFIENFNYFRGSPFRFKRKVLKVMKTQINDPAPQPVTQKTGRMIRDLLMREFKQNLQRKNPFLAHHHIPIAIKTMMKAVDGISQNRALKIKNLLISKAKNNNKPRKTKSNMPLVLDLLINSKFRQKQDPSVKLSPQLARKAERLLLKTKTDSTKTDQNYKIKNGTIPSVIRDLMLPVSFEPEKDKFIEKSEAMEIEKALQDDSFEEKLIHKKQEIAAEKILKVLSSQTKNRAVDKKPQSNLLKYNRRINSKSNLWPISSPHAFAKKMFRHLQQVNSKTGQKFLINVQKSPKKLKSHSRRNRLFGDSSKLI